MQSLAIGNDGDPGRILGNSSDSANALKFRPRGESLAETIVVELMPDGHDAIGRATAKDNRLIGVPLYAHVSNMLTNHGLDRISKSFYSLKGEATGAGLLPGKLGSIQ